MSASNLPVGVAGPDPTVRQRASGEKTPRLRHHDFIGLGLTAVIGVAVSVVLDGAYQFSIASSVIIFAILALGFYFVFSLGGQFSFGHNAFFAVGGYVAAVAGADFGFWVCFVLSVAATVVLAMAFKLVMIRVPAMFFSMATLAFGQIAVTSASRWESVTGGFTGRPVLGFAEIPGFTFDTPQSIYLLLLGFLLMGVLLGVFIERSPLRRRLVAARDVPIVASVVGGTPKTTEFIAFIVGSGYAGAAGCLFAFQQHYVSVDSFSVLVSLQALLMVLIGGSSSIWGAILGAIFVTGLPSVLGPLKLHSDLVYSLLVLGTVILFPGGLIGALQAGRRLVARRF